MTFASAPVPRGSHGTRGFSQNTIWPRGFDDTDYRPYGAKKPKMEDRPFMVWDGEGGAHDVNGKQAYFLLGYHNVEDTDWINGEDLRTDELLEWLYRKACEFPDYIHVSFGFGYDVDQITKDVPDEILTQLVETGQASYDEWKLQYLPHKWLKIKRLGTGTKEITIFDVMTFFGTSLVKAAKEYVPGHPLLEKVASGKNERGGFEYKNLQWQILPYWKVENELLLETMNALRQSLKGAGINLTSWHGPGAVANTLIKKHRLGSHIEQSRDEMPIQVTEAAQFAFFGGRFENRIIGHIHGPIHAYDIRSAYPAALSQMPGLRNGSWRRRYDPVPDSVNEWGIYRYTLRKGISSPTVLGLGPFPNRAPNGTVSFALCGTGWIYGHELRAAILAGFGEDIDIHESWEYVPNDPRKVEYPFVFTHEMYVKRAQYKRAGNPAQLGLKLGMNSVYGKLAQTVGYDEETLSPPRYHQSWYAGSVTSWCRARIFLAMSQNPNAVIACETDGIYSREPLSLRIGTHLGEWEHEIYDEMYYIQSGMYFARKGKCPTGCKHSPNDSDSECAWSVAKVRGLSAGKSTDLPKIFSACDTLSSLSTTVHRYGSLTGFIGNARQSTWFDQERNTEWGGGGKRYHDSDSCPRCNGTGRDSFHVTTMTRPDCGESSPRGLPWTENPELVVYGP